MAKANFSVRESVRAYEAKNLLDDVTARSLVVKDAQSSTKKNGGAIITVDILSARFAPNDTVTLTALKEKGLVPKKENAIKILARGTLNKPLTVIADNYSADAIKMIVLTGGKAIIGNR